VVNQERRRERKGEISSDKVGRDPSSDIFFYPSDGSLKTNQHVFVKILVVVVQVTQSSFKQVVLMEMVHGTF